MTLQSLELTQGKWMRGGQDCFIHLLFALCSVVGQSVEMKAEALRPSNKSLPEDWLA